MRRLVTAVVLALAIGWPVGGTLAQEPPPLQCGPMLACRSAEINLESYWGLPLIFQGQSTCAQFCSADYWVRNASRGAVVLQYGHGGPMGPPLLAWGFVGVGEPAAQFRLRAVVWVYRPDAAGLDDGWYEDTEYRWDATRESLVAGAVRRLVPEERDGLVPSLQAEGLQVLFGPVR